jgi:hypothetical protein
LINLPALAGKEWCTLFLQSQAMFFTADQMTDTMRRMETCLTRLSAHLIELERETGAANPNPKWVLEHTNAILRLLDEISTMGGGSHAAK